MFSSDERTRQFYVAFSLEMNIDSHNHVRVWSIVYPPESTAMTHKFQIQHEVEEFSLNDFRQALANPEFHATLVSRLPGTKVVIERSECVDNQYHMQRALNLAANIPKLAEKFLQDALRIKRVELWDFNSMTAQFKFILNMPAEFRCAGKLLEQNGKVYFQQDWEVDVRIPLIHGTLARHAEAEIRRFNAIETEAFQATLREFCA